MLTFSYVQSKVKSKDERDTPSPAPGELLRTKSIENMKAPSPAPIESASVQRTKSMEQIKSSSSDNLLRTKSLDSLKPLLPVANDAIKNLSLNIIKAVNGFNPVKDVHVPIVAPTANNLHNAASILEALRATSMSAATITANGPQIIQIPQTSVRGENDSSFLVTDASGQCG